MPNSVTRSLTSKAPRLSSRSKKIIVAVFIVIVAAIGVRALFSSRDAEAVDPNQAVIADPVAEVAVNQNFSIPLKDTEGKEVSQLKFLVENAQLRDEIIVQGQRATAIEGRVFLIINAKIVNDFNQGVETNVRDFFRLLRNGNEVEKLAADIHNDPTEVQAISTKQIRLGFPINKSDTNLVLQVGEIKGDKQYLPLNFE